MLYKIFLYTILFLILGCNKHVDNGANNSLVGSLNVSPANPKDYTIPVGISKKFVAVYQDVDGTFKDVSKDVTWNSSNSNIASVDKEGNVSALQKGSIFINAKLSNGVSAKSSVVNISNPNLIGIHITSDNMQAGKVILELGTQEYLSAFAEYDDGTDENITNFANWVSSHPDNLSVNSKDKKGLITANKMILGADIEVSASFAKATSKIIVNLVDEPLSGFIIQPQTIDVNVNDVKQVRAIAKYQSTQEDVSALSSWSVLGNGNFIEFVQNLPGVIHALREGKANIKSKFNGSEAIAEVNVINGEISPITCPVGLGASFCGGGKDNVKDEQAAQLFAGLIDTANAVRCTAVPVYYDITKNATYLLSAAHCFIDKKHQNQDIDSTSFAHIGSGKNGDKGWYLYQGVKINYSDAGTINSKAYAINAIYVHNKYCQGSSIVNGNCPNQALDNPNKQDNDIAIVRVSGKYADPAKYPFMNGNINVVNLYDKILTGGYGLNPPGIAVPAGNIYLHYSDSNFGGVSNFVNPGYSYVYNGNIIAYDNMMAMVCPGDSGGPDLWYDKANKKWQVIAIHTAGMGCGFSGNQYLPPNVAPDISTRVDKYSLWVQNILDGNACNAATSCACSSNAGSGIHCQ